MTDERELGPIGRAAFTARGIRPETAERFGIYTGKAGPGGSVLPSAKGNVVVFPYLQNDQYVGEKYRGPGKKFWQRPGSKQIFWNEEVIELAAGDQLVITEGELDALTAIDCGFDRTVSVPNGAPSAEVKDDDPERGKFAYIWDARLKLREVKTFVLAVDNDEPGRLLAAELSRRLSVACCKFVEYPEGCKDLNDVLMKHGQAAVVSVINNAKLYPLRGIYRLAEYPPKPELQTCETGWTTLNALLKPFPGELMVVTGIPGNGKSSWVMHLIANICDTYNWTAAVFSPEMPLVPHLRNKLRAIKIGKPSRAMADDDLREADEWIQQRFVFLDADPSGGWEEDDRTLEWVLEKATEAVLRDAIRILVIDPWNEVEHSKRRDELMTDYIGRGIRELRRFAQQHGVIVIVIAHPTKEIAKEKEKRAPGLYDIDGSAHWANKPDHGVSVFRPDDDGNLTEIYVTKVRFSETGFRGKVVMRYDPLSERYSMLQPLEDFR